MANPTPQHTPTDGLGTAEQITLTSNGTGGSVLTAVVAGRLYTTAASVSGATINGVVYNATFTLTAAVKDIAGSAFTTGQGNVVTWKSLNPQQATVNSGGLVTAVSKGMAVIEAEFPIADNTEGVDSASGEQKDAIYVQVNVQVYP